MKNTCGGEKGPTRAQKGNARSVLYFVRNLIIVLFLSFFSILDKEVSNFIETSKKYIGIL